MAPKQNLVTLGFIFGLVFFFMAPQASARAATMYATQATAFNLFLVSWLDVLCYILAVIFFSMALSNLDFR